MPTDPFKPVWQHSDDKGQYSRYSRTDEGWLDSQLQGSGGDTEPFIPFEIFEGRRNVCSTIVERRSGKRIPNQAWHTSTYSECTKHVEQTDAEGQADASQYSAFLEKTRYMNGKSS